MITKLQAHKSASRRLVPSRRSDPEDEQQLSDGSQMRAQAGGDRIGKARQLPPRSRRVERPPKGQGSAGDGRGTHRERVDVVVVVAVAPVLPRHRRLLLLLRASGVVWGGGQPLLPASAELLPAALPSTSSMRKGKRGGAVRFVVNDRWGQVSLSGGPGDPKGQTGRTVRDLVACLA